MSLLHHLLPYPRAVRAMGFPQEVTGIRGRYLRCRSQWQPHLERTREMILRGARQAKQHRKAILLGGGLLHDVPIAELSRMFREVVLVDVVHPWSSLWAARRLRNVRRLRADVTETIRDVYRVAWDADLPLPRSEPGLFLDDAEVDFVASINLLSQLPCMPMAYLNREQAHSSQKVEDFARQLIQAHQDYLDRFSGHVTLVTDVERIKINLMGQIVERRDLFFGLPWPGRDEEWEWKLAPCPEADRGHHYHRRVFGIVDWKSRLCGAASTGNPVSCSPDTARD